MNHRTVENAKIRVSVSQEIWDAFSQRAKSVSAFSGLSVDVETRAMILSEAFARLRKEEYGPDNFTADMVRAGMPATVLVYAELRFNLFNQWAAENCPRLLIEEADLMHDDHARAAELYVENTVKQFRLTDDSLLQKALDGDELFNMRAVHAPPAKVVEALNAAADFIRSQLNSGAEFSASSNGWEIQRI